MYYMARCNDRRRFQRLNLNLSMGYKVDIPLNLRIRLGDEEIPATTLNISEAGMAFLTSYDIPVWSRILIRFSLFKVNQDGQVNFYKPLQVTAEVRSNIVSENKEYRLGVCFVRKDIEIKDEIRDFVKTAS